MTLLHQSALPADRTKAALTWDVDAGAAAMEAVVRFRESVWSVT
jgi:hypothetical protein